MLWDFLETLGAAILIVGMVAKTYLPVWVGLPMMIVFVVYRGLKNVIEIRLVTHLLRILFFAILIFFVILKGGLLDAFSILLGAMYGGLETILTELAKLAIEGHVAIYVACLAFVALVVARKLGFELASKLVRKVFSIAAPVFVLLVFVVTASGGDLREAFVLGSSILALTAMLQGLGLMFFGGFKKDKMS